MKLVRSLFATVALAAVCGHAAATACAASDIGGAAVLDCAGFVDKNWLNSAHTDQLIDELAGLGLDWDGTAIDKIENLSGATTVEFTTPITGLTWIGMHFGNGTGGPGNATAFYLVDAGAGLDSLTLNYSASSNLWVFATSPQPSQGDGELPEPASLALAALGLTAGAFATRRRRTL